MLCIHSSNYCYTTSPKKLVGSEFALRMFESDLGFSGLSVSSTMLHIMFIADGKVFIFYIANRLEEQGQRVSDSIARV